jgi:hypothetical protein
MKSSNIALCFSGQIRTGIYAAPNIKRFIGNLWDDCDFFMHTWDVSNEKPTPEQARDGNMFGNKQEIDFEAFNKIYNFKKIDITPRIFLGDRGQWLSWLLSMHLKQKYDYVVKIRPDVIYHESLNLLDMIKKTPPKSVSVMETFIDPADRGSDDVLYIADSKTMDLFVNFVNEIPLLTIPKSPHHALYKYAMDHGIIVNDLNCGYFSGNYTVLRQQCVSYCTLTEFEKCEKMDKSIYYPAVRKVE